MQEDEAAQALASGFQFHNGSIKGVEGLPDVALAEASFNSTMVRLKAVRRLKKIKSFSMTYFFQN